MLEDLDIEVAEQLTSDPEEAEEIVRCFQMARHPTQAEHVLQVHECFAYLCFFYPVAQKARMEANGDKVQKQFVERYIEGALNALDKGLIAYMAQLRKERTF